MKKMLFLLQICLMGYCFAVENDIPSFESSCSGLIGCSQEESAFFTIRNKLCFNEEMAVSSIEAILTQWFHEEPELIEHASVRDIGNGQTGSYADIFNLMAKAVAILTKIAPDPENQLYMSNASNRFKEVVRVLKKLGVEQTISDEQLNILSQQLAQELL